MSKSQRYRKMDAITHILHRPDMYVGSMDAKDIYSYIAEKDNEEKEDEKKEKIIISQKNVNISPAFLRIFVEPLSNCIDNVTRGKESGTKTTKISIEINRKTGQTTFWNDGETIPIEIHAEEKCYVHTMIFGQLLTGSNYDDTEDRLDISGKNGLGVKLTNVFSKEFSVEGADPSQKKKLIQSWTNNMKTPSEPNIEKFTLKKGYTRVSFIPDFKLFGMEGYTEEIIQLYRRYAIDTAMVTRIPVHFNEEIYSFKSLQDYCELFPNISGEKLYIKTERCEVVLTPSEHGEFQHISFVNGINTPLGGKHVEAWCEAIFRPLLEKVNAKKKKGSKEEGPKLNITEIQRFFRLFVTASVSQPKFDSQSKFTLEAPTVEAEVKESHINAIKKWSIIAEINDLLASKSLGALKKLERKRGFVNIPKLTDANKVKKSGKDCTLILVEGKSAKTYVVSGLEIGIFGRKGWDWNGIYQLQGKPLNPCGKSPKTITENNEVSDIIKALGIKIDTDYTLDENYEKLRYGRVLITTDADVDGLHITGLIQNLFYRLFPSLLKREPPFLTAMQTPIVIVSHGPREIYFYDEREYHKYVKDHAAENFSKKYLKGLASNNKENVEMSFGRKIVKFFQDEKAPTTLAHTFDTKKVNTDYRKDWIANYNSDNVVLTWEGDDPETKNLSITDFLNTEMIKHAIDNCSRTIPNCIDGLKESQRKALYGTILRRLNYSAKKTIKVFQLVGSITEKTGYHHGDKSMNDTIIGMAAYFIGGNNIPLFYRDGQFGSRMDGGKDAGHPRYISTKLDRLTRLIFRPEDDILLTHVESEGEKYEPEYFVPILPMVLVNGSIGIGTGWSSFVPCFDPVVLCDAIRGWLGAEKKILKENEDGSVIRFIPELIPWYHDHKGEMIYDEKAKRYLSQGVFERTGKKIHITELPVGVWTNSFQEKLDEMRAAKQIADYEQNSTEMTIDFTITENNETVCDENTLGLYESISMKNMVLFTADHRLKKFESADEIFEHFCEVRYATYVRRKKHRLNELEYNILLLGNKKRFLEEVRDEKIKLFDEIKGKKQSKKTATLVAELEKAKYDKDLVAEEKKRETDSEDENEDTDEERDEKKKSSKHGYEYLLRLQIGQITAERIDKLKKEILSTQEERYRYANQSEEELWLKELQEFEDAYKTWAQEQREVKTKSKKKAATRGRKRKVA